jgi:hypothetical protein
VRAGRDADRRDEAGPHVTEVVLTAFGEQPLEVGWLWAHDGSPGAVAERWFPGVDPVRSPNRRRRRIPGFTASRTLGASTGRPPPAFLDAGALPTLHDRYGLSTDKIVQTVRTVA